MGNGITLQICQARIESTPAGLWSLAVLEDLCARLQPDLAGACKLEETYAKNVSREGGGFEAIGYDVSRYLPGAYWANFFGEAYCDFIGRDRLLAAPAHEVREIGLGILAIMSKQPQDWDTTAYNEKVERFLDHVGREYFFERADPDKPTKSPWDLPKLPQHGNLPNIQVKHLGGGTYEILNPEIREVLGGNGILDEDVE